MSERFTSEGQEPQRKAPFSDAEVEVHYTSPAEQLEEPLPHHAFELLKDDKVIGGAEVEYFSRPLPFYQLTELWVEPEYTGSGGASRIMDQVENFLEERKKPGILTDAITDDNPAKGLYERRGWQLVPDQMLHVYNWPDHVPTSILQGYAFRQTDLTDRASWQQEETTDDELRAAS